MLAKDIYFTQNIDIRRFSAKTADISAVPTKEMDVSVMDFNISSRIQAAQERADDAIRRAEIKRDDELRMLADEVIGFNQEQLRQLRSAASAMERIASARSFALRSLSSIHDDIAHGKPISPGSLSFNDFPNQEAAQKFAARINSEALSDLPVKACALGEDSKCFVYVASDIR